MRQPLTSALAVGAVILLASSCSSSGNDSKPVAPANSATVNIPATTAASQYASAQAIADKLEAAGFTVSMLHKNDDISLSLGMDAAYDFTVTEKPGAAPGDSGINLFRSPEALTTWVGMSKGFGGIAVVGDTWAVSLTTSTSAAVTSSKAMAPRIAKVLGGTVQE